MKKFMRKIATTIILLVAILGLIVLGLFALIFMVLEKIFSTPARLFEIIWDWLGAIAGKYVHWMVRRYTPAKKEKIIVVGETHVDQ